MATKAPRINPLYADEPPSRSQKKRESTALQKMGEALTRLSKAQRNSLNLPPELAEALDELPGISTHEGKRRQSQYVGRLMREMSENGDALDMLQQALDAFQQGHSTDTALQHQAEQLRESLLTLTLEQAAELLQPWPEQKESLLRLVQSAREEKENSRPPKNSRALFRALRACLAESGKQ